MNLYFSVKFKLVGGHLNDVTEKILNLAQELKFPFLKTFVAPFFPIPLTAPGFQRIVST